MILAASLESGSAVATEKARRYATRLDVSSGNIMAHWGYLMKMITDYVFWCGVTWVKLKEDIIKKVTYFEENM